MASGFLGFMQGFAATDATIAEERAKKIDQLDLFAAEQKMLADTKAKAESNILAAKSDASSSTSAAIAGQVDGASAQDQTNAAAGVQPTSPTGTAPINPQATPVSVQNTTPSPFQNTMANPNNDPNAAPVAPAAIKPNPTQLASANNVDSMFGGASQTPPVGAAPTSIPSATQGNLAPWDSLDAQVKLKYNDVAVSKVPVAEQSKYLGNKVALNNLGKEEYEKSQTSTNDNLSKVSDTAVKNREAGYDPTKNVFVPVWQQDKDAVLSQLNNGGKGYNVGETLVAPSALTVTDRKQYQDLIKQNETFLKDDKVADAGENAGRAVALFGKTIDQLGKTDTGVLQGSAISQQFNKLINDPEQSILKAFVAQGKAYQPRPGTRIFASELAPGGLLEQESAALSNPKTANYAAMTNLVNTANKIDQGSKFYQSIASAFPMDVGKAKQAIDTWASSNPLYIMQAGKAVQNKAYVPMTDWDFTTSQPKPHIAEQNNKAANDAWDISAKEIYNSLKQ